MNCSDASVGRNTPFKSCKSPNEIYCTEISNERVSRISTYIKEQLHYDTWREIQKTVLSSSDESKGKAAILHVTKYVYVLLSFPIFGYLYKKAFL